jgi:hypothetical protein
LTSCALILSMQTLGLSDSTPRTGNRLKSLFWPSIQTGTDVDYLGAQGYWVCSIVSVCSFVFSSATGHAFAGVFVLLFYYLGGVGVRERSRYAAAAVLVMYLTDAFASRRGVVTVFIGALLLSNLRATWIAANWRADSEESIPPPRLAETWGDKFVDRLPMWLWPKVRGAYYVFSGCFLLLAGTGLIITVLHRAG